jgi:hypothetical protein
MVKLKARLYVKSVKTVTDNVEVNLEYEDVQGAWTGQVLGELGESPGGYYAGAPSRPPNVRIGPKEEYVLPEDQKQTVRMVRSIASKYGLQVEVVDVVRENFLRREIQREREKIRIFPTLIASSGERIEGNITEGQVESLLSRTVERTQEHT